LDINLFIHSPILVKSDSMAEKTKTDRQTRKKTHTQKSKSEAH